MTIAERYAEFLISHGITHAFGIVGSANLSIFEALARRITVVSTHHEQAAAIAAAYFYRVSGRLAPCLVTAGAGAMNALTGVQEAYMDSVPLLVISGNEQSRFFGAPHNRSIGFQGFEVAEVVRTFTKYAKRVDGMDALSELEAGFKRALTPRQGPVWIDVPQDIARSGT